MSNDDKFKIRQNESKKNALKEASISSMKGIIKYGDEPLVSSD